MKKEMFFKLTGFKTNICIFLLKDDFSNSDSRNISFSLRVIKKLLRKNSLIFVENIEKICPCKVF